jgi:hypothetical protein
MSESMPRCPKCKCADKVRKGTVPKTGAPPGHPYLAATVGLFKLAHWAGIINCYGYYCERCQKSFDT